MKKNQKTVTMISIFGFIGILGVLLTIVSDLILTGKPTSAYTYFRVGTESMASLPEWRITFGTFLGIIVLPLQIGGLVTIYYALKPAGKIKSFLTVLPIAHGLITAIAFHISYAFIGYGWNIYYSMGQNSTDVSQLLHKFSFYWKVILIIIAIDIIISTLFYTLLILKKKTLYPKWMAFINPLCIFIVMYYMILLIPAPIGGFVAPAFLNLSTLIFFTFSTLTIKIY